MTRDKIFISHRITDEKIGDMIKDFLVATGIPNEQIFCSSLPGNDVNEKIGPEVKKWIKESAIIILILSTAYYESAYCLNEAGIAWYLDDEVLLIPFGLNDINHNDMAGFLNSDYKMRRIDEDGDISYMYDSIVEKLNIQSTKHGIITQEIKKLKERYIGYSGEEKRQHTEKTIIGEKSKTNNIVLLADIMLFYAAYNNGEIIVSKTLSGSTYLAGGKYNLNASQHPREIAKCDAAIKYLKENGFIELANSKNKNDVYKVTEYGYEIADGFKEDNDIDPDMPPELVIQLFNRNDISS